MASMIFTDCSPYSTARLLPLGSSHSVFCLRRLVGPFHMGPINPPSSFRSLSVHSSSSSSASPVVPTVIAPFKKKKETIFIYFAFRDYPFAHSIDRPLQSYCLHRRSKKILALLWECIGCCRILHELLWLFRPLLRLGVILVGDKKDSATYVRNKKTACDSVGINSFEAHLPEDSSEEEVLKFISGFNDDPTVHGILVQLPLPSHMKEQNILNAVRIEKDVDGFHPLNIGHLAMRGRDPLFVPCTPKGCIELLHRYGVSIKGKKAVVIGWSNIVGMPAALLLQREDATIKPGVVIIDVGINPVEDAKSSRGYRLVRDVCYEEACKIASAVTPIPGGVGPMTIAMHLLNTLSPARRMHDFK
ncbi:Bifunctional protein folD [Quillaja saponaria]|uniref:Bifunctional protein folD n=1 Tax=Quillaja saponaria TaxID=32244 RepID=A0AAD7LQI3_QUISA|nr:Bifunctional protein folD [Quillaja saponaria]